VTLTLQRGSANLCAVIKKVVVEDNYDSFTYNLVQYIEALGVETRVFLNDKADCATILHQNPSGILLSPGPGTPDDAGITLEVIAQLAGRIPILGVCLGHQSIGQAFGGKVIRAERLMHGKTSLVRHDGKTIFSGMPQPFQATRYHSLIVDASQLPDCLEVSADTDAQEIMGLRHRSLPIEGVQFHPESFLTQDGLRLVRNWLETL
jgi:anthranilate synthase/aminodeoxychorismate synthase-like glutamine amidotransferase